MEAPNSKLESIKTDLSEMYQRDQNMRNQHLSSDKIEWDSTIDGENTRALKLIVQEIGWPTISLVGAESSMQAWLLVQHADHDPEFQSHCLELMKKCPDGEVKKPNIAYLDDRIRTGKGQPQLYGTQFNGNFEPLSIEDSEKLEERRAQMGMESFEANQKMLKAMYDQNT